MNNLLAKNELYVLRRSSSSEAYARIKFAANDVGYRRIRPSLGCIQISPRLVNSWPSTTEQMQTKDLYCH